MSLELGRAINIRFSEGFKNPLEMNSEELREEGRRKPKPISPNQRAVLSRIDTKIQVLGEEIRAAQLGLSWRQRWDMASRSDLLLQSSVSNVPGVKIIHWVAK